jgi:hypothetical protein
LLAAVATFGLGLGNHLTIVGILPACALYVFLRDRRFLTARVALAVVGIMLLCLSQYGFIVLRTYQGAPYLESRATSLTELISVVTAERFANQRFAFNVTELTTVHGPKVASLIAEEIGVAGLLLLGSGLVAGVLRRIGGVGLVAGAAAGMLAMVLNLSGDLTGLITPVVALLWRSALWVSMQSRGDSKPCRSLGEPGSVALVAAVAMPLTNAISNFKAADQSGQTADARFVRSV